MRLTKEEAARASKLFQERPPVLPGTRVILDDGQRAAWYARVTQEIKALKIQDSRAMSEFCDLAGVPD